MNGSMFFHFMANINFIIIAVAAMLVLVRILYGPGLSRRVVAADLIANLCMAAIVSFAQWSDNPIYLNIIISIALVIFLSTIAYAQYITSRAKIILGEEKND